MLNALIPVIGHVGHWFEAIMFAPVIILVIFVSVKSIVERRSDHGPNEEVS